MKRIFVICSLIVMMFGCASQQQQPSVSIEQVNPDINESLTELVSVLVDQFEEKSSFTLQVQGSLCECGQSFRLFFFRKPISHEEDIKKDTEENAEQSVLRK